MNTAEHCLVEIKKKQTFFVCEVRCTGIHCIVDGF